MPNEIDLLSVTPADRPADPERDTGVYSPLRRWKRCPFGQVAMPPLDPDQLATVTNPMAMPRHPLDLYDESAGLLLEAAPPSSRRW
jgi:hypothetical protein